MINLHRLRLLNQLSQLGSLTAVAKINGVTRPAISRQMSLFEQELNTVLFERSKSGITFTLAGLDLVEKSKILFSYVEQIELSFLNKSNVISGNYRISAFSSYSMGRVPDVIRLLGSLYPELHITFCELSSQDGVKALLSREVDLAIIDEWAHLPIGRNRLCIEDLEKDRFVAVLPAGHPLAQRKSIPLKLLSNETWTINQSASVYRSMLLDACLEAGFTPNEAFSCQNVSAVIEFICKMKVVSVLPFFSVRPFLGYSSIQILDLTQPIYRKIRAVSLSQLSRANVTLAVVGAFREVATAQ